MNTTFHLKNTIVVLADDRERASGVIESLVSTPGVSVDVLRLKLGDYDIGSRLLVERKTTPDFAQSVIDGRLFRQAYRLMISQRRTCLILEGPLRDIQMTREALQGAMITVTLAFGQPLLRSRTPAETAWLMLTAAQQLSRSEVQNHGRKVRRKVRRRRRIQSEMLQAIPGLGPNKADALLTRFGDFQRIASADLDEIMQISGIGQVTATQILWALGVQR